MVDEEIEKIKKFCVGLLNALNHFEVSTRDPMIFFIGNSKVAVTRMTRGETCGISVEVVTTIHTSFMMPEPVEDPVK